jgi:hypothetical protein
VYIIASPQSIWSSAGLIIKKHTRRLVDKRQDLGAVQCLLVRLKKNLEAVPLSVSDKKCDTISKICKSVVKF